MTQTTKKCPFCQKRQSSIDPEELMSMITDDDNWIAVTINGKKATIELTGEGSENEREQAKINFCPVCGRQLRKKLLNIQPEKNRQYYASI